MSNGDVYDGTYKHGMKNGQFKVTFADGSVFRGDFEDDQI